MRAFVGTSGWSYPEWQPGFYPGGVPRTAFLEHYASVLTACEINATHYRLPTPDMVRRWRASVPDGFRFTVKAHRRLTDTATMAWGPAEVAFLHRFLTSVGELGEALGAVLLQFADEHRRDDAALEVILSALPADVPFAVELRHEEWQDPAVTAMIADAGATRCVGETAGTAMAALPPGPIAYVRLRADHYDDSARRAWRDLLDREARERPVFAIARHQDLPADDPYAGVGFAAWLVSTDLN